MSSTESLSEFPSKPLTFILTLTLAHTCEVSTVRGAGVRSEAVAEQASERSVAKVASAERRIVLSKKIRLSEKMNKSSECLWENERVN